MMAFLSISDKFGDWISRAVKGNLENGNDADEVLNFQLEQWRKRAVGNYSLREIRVWLADPALRPPSWAILLNLRAESVRSLLFRPFFFPLSNDEASKKQFQPALELVENVIHVLFGLDVNTDIYRKQHPYYQHLLASACALYFLLVSYVQWKMSVSDPLPTELVCNLSSIFEMALTLAAKYINSSPASRRLWKRLLAMGKTLNNLGILSNDRGTENEQLAQSYYARSGTSEASSSRPIQDPSSPRLDERNPPTSSGEYSQLHWCCSDLLGNGAGATPAGENDFQLGLAESLLFEWPLGEHEILGLNGRY